MKEVPNLFYFHEIAGDDHDFMQKFIKRFKEEFLWEVGMYLRYMNNKEPREAAEIVTKSKYKFGMLGMENAFHLANDHLENLQIGDDSMHRDFDTILENVGQFLKGI